MQNSERQEPYQEKKPFYEPIQREVTKNVIEAKIFAIKMQLNTSVNLSVTVFKQKEKRPRNPLYAFDSLWTFSLAFAANSIRHQS